MIVNTWERMEMYRLRKERRMKRQQLMKWVRTITTSSLLLTIMGVITACAMH